MKGTEILKHFQNGSTVECLEKKIKAKFESNNLSLRDFYDSENNPITVWGFHDYKSNSFIFLERDGQLARVIPNDIECNCINETDIVFLQLGKEVKAILDKETNYTTIGEKISKLYRK